MEDSATKRHPFRSFFKFLMVIGVLSAIVRLVASKKEEYYGLTESEARAKFESKLGPRIGEKKASEVADQVIPRLMDSGVIKADPVEAAVDDTTDGAKDAADSVADMAKDKASDGGDALEDVGDDVKPGID
jgi:hypothetical protein